MGGICGIGKVYCNTLGGFYRGGVGRIVIDTPLWGVGRVSRDVSLFPSNTWVDGGILMMSHMCAARDFIDTSEAFLRVQWRGISLVQRTMCLRTPI